MNSQNNSNVRYMSTSYQVDSTEAVSVRTERIDKRKKINLNIIELLTKEKLKAKK